MLAAYLTDPLVSFLKGSASPDDLGRRANAIGAPVYLIARGRSGGELVTCNVSVERRALVVHTFGEVSRL